MLDYFNFKDTNVHISHGPMHLSREGKDLNDYLNYLQKNEIRHVFAIGRLAPYYPQDEATAKISKEFFLKNDFDNYFLPDAKGDVHLPEGVDAQITSKIVAKVGRIVSYEITINNGTPILVHHYPLRDKQPLDLTEEELNYILSLQQQARDSNEQVHTHCRNGRGRSAQMAYILASTFEDKAAKPYEERFIAMRIERVITGRTEAQQRAISNPENSKSFIETEEQKAYILGLEESLARDIREPMSKERDFLRQFMSIELAFREEIARQTLKHGDLFSSGRDKVTTGNFTETQRKQAQFNEIYHLLHEANSEKNLREIIAEARNLSIVSKEFLTAINLLEALEKKFHETPPDFKPILYNYINEDKGIFKIWLEHKLKNHTIEEIKEEMDLGHNDDILKQMFFDYLIQQPAKIQQWQFEVRIRRDVSYDIKLDKQKEPLIIDRDRSGKIKLDERGQANITGGNFPQNYEEYLASRQKLGENPGYGYEHAMRLNWETYDKTIKTEEGNVIKKSELEDFYERSAQEQYKEEFDFEKNQFDTKIKPRLEHQTDTAAIHLTLKEIADRAVKKADRHGQQISLDKAKAKVAHTYIEYIKEYIESPDSFKAGNKADVSWLGGKSINIGTDKEPELKRVPTNVARIYNEACKGFTDEYSDENIQDIEDRFNKIIDIGAKASEKHPFFGHRSDRTQEFYDKIKEAHEDRESRRPLGRH